MLQTSSVFIIFYLTLDYKTVGSSLLQVMLTEISFLNGEDDVYYINGDACAENHYECIMIYLNI